jgi:hypothetical protein
VRPEGLEPPAYWFEANRSIQLSYGRGSGDRDLMVSKDRIQKGEFRSQNSEAAASYFLPEQDRKSAVTSTRDSIWQFLR